MSDQISSLIVQLELKSASWVKMHQHKVMS